MRPTSYHCFHCSLRFNYAPFQYEGKNFCCRGCKTVFQLIKNKELDTFYELIPGAGNIPQENQDRFDILKNLEFARSFISFEKEGLQHALFSIPSIHCSACIWILEQLDQFDAGIVQSTVNFSKKTLRFVYQTDRTSLYTIALLLASLGYPPDISLGHQSTKKESNKRLLQQIGIAGFAFGNCMFMSLSTYFESQEFWMLQFRPWFDLLSFLLSLPVLFFSAQDYFITAWKGLKAKFLTLNVPIALGISVLFLRSTYVVFFSDGLGYFDSLNGLVFFLLIGKFMQQKVYSNFSYDRNYTSFFPLGLHKIMPDQSEAIVPLKSIKVSDQIALRVGELIPADCTLNTAFAEIDYSFVTGESKAVREDQGSTLYAGGKILKQNCTATVIREVEESQLIQLWNQPVFQKKTAGLTPTLTDQLSRYFTPFVLLFAVGVSCIWAFIDPQRIVEIFTAVLIVACPCALALSAPFVFGNMLRYFDQLSFYPRSSEVLETLTKITHLVFDKTGTLTDPNGYEIRFIGNPLLPKEKDHIKSLCYQSNHPLSQALFLFLKDVSFATNLPCTHHLGKGLEAEIEGRTYLLGSAQFVDIPPPKNNPYTLVHLSIDGKYKGFFELRPSYRKHLKKLLHAFPNYPKTILTGDTSQSIVDLQKHIPKDTKVLFEQNPFEKIHYIQKLQEKGAKVLMIGDGLNDAGALQQSDFGIAINNHTHTFTPACDAIIKGTDLYKLASLIKATRTSLRFIYISFAGSLLYNALGLSIAAMGYLSPLIAAVLMPLSSITVVLFAYAATFLLFKKIKKNLKT